ncbi:lytic transglycosylase [Diaphorobacter nitroreducens]|uniref:lytic transglycosylase domain-containing protein n=1 Tax=Diaphorobacter nitroreducens TaxID=164759 RepID=UPI000B59E50F|nr:lytic transglycosylase domain-containing protein [Diaphorobacter nitroreducens]ASI68673.1 lytic transglycosylase [Diaphorobacter nitroreducens]
MPRPLLIAVCLLYGLPAGAQACWNDVAQRHGVPADLLYAVAKVESSLDPKAVNRSHFNRTRSIDIGLMQINSRHLPKLAQQGITEARLFEPCTNLDVGAQLLADLFARKGLSWDSVGAYNAACTELKGDACTEARARYAWKVYRQLPGNKPVAHRAPASRQLEVAPAARPTIPLLAVRVAP